MNQIHIAYAKHSKTCAGNSRFWFYFWLAEKGSNEKPEQLHKFVFDTQLKSAVTEILKFIQIIMWEWYLPSCIDPIM